MSKYEDQVCRVDGCTDPVTNHLTQSPRGVAALTTPPDQWEHLWYCKKHYDEKYVDNPSVLDSGM